MASNARNLANLLGAGEATISAEKLGSDVPPGTEDYSSVDSLGVGTTIGETAFVEGTNRLYIWNGSGWYNIALINTTPTWDSGGQPAGTYVLDGDSPQDATVITLAASDPEGLPISYNYITGGSMDSIATISQDSSVFTITPKTSVQAPAGGTGSITFRATDGVNILPQVSSFTLNFISIIENSRYTTLLATATDTSDNNNITDASTNNHSITVSGDTHAGTFSPYRPGGYSWDFQGAGFYTNDLGHGESIEAENTASAFNVGTNDYTIEGWFKERNNETYSTNPYARLFDLGPNDNISLMRNYPNTGGKKLLLKENSTVIITSTNDVFDGNWHFIQVVRTGGYTKLYVDGTEEGSVASTTNINSISKIIVGAWSDYSYGFDGQIADFRFSNIARTASVPTERLTSDSNTKLLVCSKPYLVDESGTATSLVLRKSTNGTRDYPDPIAFSPYNYNEYSATDHGGSVYFDGTTDYIEHQGGFTLPTGTNANWTIECWVNLDQVNSNQGILRVSSTAANGNNDDIYFSEQSGYINTACKGGAIASTTANYKMYANTWHHIAMVKNSGTVYLYNNGVYCGSVSDSNDYSGNYYVYGGLYYSSSYCFAGYLSDFKISNSAIYTTGTSNFTPPTAPLSSSGASLHIKGTDASIIDKSQSTNLQLVGNTTGSTTQVKFAGSKSMYFDGTGDYITIAADKIPDLGAEDWTIETWFYTSNLSADFWILSQGDNGNNLPMSWFKVKSDGGTHLLTYTGGNIPVNFHTTAGEVTANTWHHIALTHEYNGSNGGTWRVYIDGSKSSVTIGNDTYTNGYYWSNEGVAGKHWEIAKDVSETSNISPAHYLQDFRITNGLARYTAADETSNIPSAPLEG